MDADLEDMAALAERVDLGLAKLRESLVELAELRESLRPAGGHSASVTGLLEQVIQRLPAPE